MNIKILQDFVKEFKDKDIQNISKEELVQRENRNSKNNLPFKYSINIKENICISDPSSQENRQTSIRR